MDMSDNVFAEPADELAREREQLKAEQRTAGFAPGGASVISIGNKLKLMFGAAAAASALLGVLALFALATGGEATSGLLVAIVAVAFATVAIAGLSIRFVTEQIIHPIEAVCGA